MARAKKQSKVSKEARPPLLGTLSNLFRGDPEQVAAHLLGYGLESVQILPNFPSFKFQTAADFTTKACKDAAAPFLTSELTVAAISAHTNFIDPDRARRKKQVKRFDALIEHCGDFGTKYLVTESGTLHPAHPWEDFPDNHAEETFAALVDAMKPSMKLAEKAGVEVLIEGHLYQVVSSTDQAKKLREELGDHLGFVMDPANYFSRGMISSSTKQLKDIFKAIGKFSPVAHAKDVHYVGGDLNTPRAGTGSLDYKTFLELLDEYQPECPLILEQIRPEELRETIDFIDRFFE